MKELVVASAGPPGEQEKRLLDLAAWMGISARVLDVASPAWIERIPVTAGRPWSLALSASTLGTVIESTQRDRFRNLLATQCAELLAIGFTDLPADRPVLEWLTLGAVASRSMAESAGEKHYVVPEESRAFTRQLAGARFPAPRAERPPAAASAGDAPARRTGFEVGEGRSATPILACCGLPVCVHVRTSPCPAFLVADLPLPDLQATVVRGDALGDRPVRLIPPLLFLRHAFGAACWHAPRPTARVIIDDPLLRPRYGALDVERLHASARRLGYGATIGFIPWNHRRTALPSAALFRDPAVLSICVHGCDHTRDEFAPGDPGLVAPKAVLALERMATHQARTGIPCAPAMVFPQGRFSSAAMAALRAAGYLAAVNSSIFPTDGIGRPLRLADLLRPAVLYGGFPVFGRRPLSQPADLALDLFLGKPALVVLHHQDFVDGGESLERLVGELRRVEPLLSWPPLAEQLARTCLVRRRSAEEAEALFFTRRFHLTNDADGAVRFHLRKEEPDGEALRSVTVDGDPVPFEVRDGVLRLAVLAKPGATLHVEVEDQAGPRPPVWRPTSNYRARVGLRRALSEFRDERLTRHPTLLRAAVRLAGALGLRGGG